MFSAMENWRKIENKMGFSHYVNDHLNIKQWDHPKFYEVKQAIDECNYVIYSSYRMALKIRILQRCLFMEDVPLATVLAIFDQYKFDNSEKAILEPCDLEAVLTEIFFTSNKENRTNVDVYFASEMVINFLYDVYDRQRQGKIQVTSTKILLALLSNYSLKDLYKYLFSLYADYNNCIGRVQLKVLLQHIHDIVRYLHEDGCFGINSLNASVDYYFRDTPGFVGITELGFLSWINAGCSFLAWIPLVLKLKGSAKVIHPVKCTNCKAKPLVGLRFCCVKCPRYTQCQRCFLMGKESHSHKLSHSLRQYTSASKDNMFLTKVCGLFCPVSFEPKYSVVNPTRQFANEIIKTYQLTDMLCNVPPLSKPEEQLQGVIRQLESQNRGLQEMFLFGNYSGNEMRTYLDQYRLFMEENIKKLKILKDQINSAPEYDTKSISIPRVRSASSMLHNGVKCQTNPLSRSMDGLFCNSASSCSRSSSQLYSKPNHSDDYSTWNKRAYRRSDCWTPAPASEILESKDEADPQKSPIKKLHNKFDDALAMLQDMLANNFYLEDSVNLMEEDCSDLRVTEV